MYLFLVLLSALALCAGFWLDNVIVQPVLKWWWLCLVAAFLLLCLKGPLRTLQSTQRNYVMLGIAGCMIALLFLFGNTVIIYLVGTMLLLIWIVATRLNGSVAKADGDSPALLITLIATALVLLPISVNRIQVTLPNLSAGTQLTIYKSPNDSPDLDAQFYNQINDHAEIVASLGTEILFQQSHEAPLLQIHILRPKIVVRILSITYETRLIYFRLPLFQLAGEQLLELKVAEQGADFNMKMDHGRLLIDQLSIDEPAMVQLPHMDNHHISLSSTAIVIGARVLVWLLICFGLINWAPADRGLKVRASPGRTSPGRTSPGRTSSSGDHVV